MTVLMIVHTMMSPGAIEATSDHQQQPQRCLRDSTFSRFDTIPACDVRTDGRTEGHTTTAKTALRKHSVAQ